MFSVTNVENRPLSSNSETIESFKNLLTSQEIDKELLKDCNEKLGKYVERVEELDRQNSKLEQELVAANGSSDADVSVRMQQKLNELRKRIDEVAFEKAEMGLKFQMIVGDIEFMKTKLFEKRKKEQLQKRKIGAITKSIKSVSAEISNVTQLVEDAGQDLKKQISNLNEATLNFGKAQTILEREILARIRAENEIQTLEEEISFIERVMESDGQSNDLFEANKGEENDAFYRNEIRNVLRDIEKEFHEIETAQKEKIDALFQLRLNELGTEDGNTSKDFSQSQATSQDERGLPMSSDEGHFDISELEAKLNDQMMEYSRDEQNFEFQIAALKKEIAERQKSLITSVGESVEMRFEIETYRKLLDFEKNRFSEKSRREEEDKASRSKLSMAFTLSSANKSVPSKRNEEISTFRLRSVIPSEFPRKYIAQNSREGLKPSKKPGFKENSRWDASQRKYSPSLDHKNVKTSNEFTLRSNHASNEIRRKYSASRPIQKRSNNFGLKENYVSEDKKENFGDVVIDEADMSGDFVSISNVGLVPKDLGGWSLVRRILGLPEVNFTFPLGSLFLQPAQTVKLFSKNSDDFRRNGNSVKLEQLERWGSGTSSDTMLIASNGTLMSKLNQSLKSL